ncbi:MAG: hypothetical protein HYZ50_20310 [Deltaproteobacteria bacterium]|nr:hypothetical protein [Deltaproteobacteria bacterium]
MKRVIPCQGWQLGCLIGLNARYLLHAVACLCGNKVTLQITDATTPVHLADQDMHVIILPLRLSGEEAHALSTAPVSTAAASTAVDTMSQSFPPFFSFLPDRSFREILILSRSTTPPFYSPCRFPLVLLCPTV